MSAVSVTAALDGAETSRLAGLRVAIAHEWLTNYGGSERVVDQMVRLFPNARVLTTVLAPDRMPEPLRGAEPSLLQKIPGARLHHQPLLPLMPLSWRLRTPLADVDVGISSSHACAKAVRLPTGVPHICYCHTPMRYAWDFRAERERVPATARPAVRALMAGFRRWDAGTAAGVTNFVANSTAVAKRIRRFYGRSAVVLHPPVRTDFFTPGGETADFFLFVGRLVPYKNAELAIRAFGQLRSERLVVVGQGRLERTLRRLATSNVHFLPTVTDRSLRDLYRSARALVYPAQEDFGIVMAEAQACGTPVIGLAAGGATDIVDHGRTGWLIEHPDLTHLTRAVENAGELDTAEIRSNAERFSAARFRDGLSQIVLEAVADAR